MNAKFENAVGAYSKNLKYTRTHTLKNSCIDTLATVSVGQYI